MRPGLEFFGRACIAFFFGGLLVSTGCTLYNDYEISPADAEGDSDLTSDVRDGNSVDAADASDVPTGEDVGSDGGGEAGATSDADGGGPEVADADVDDAMDGAETPANVLENPGFEGDVQSNGCPQAWTCVTYGPEEAGDFAVDGSTTYAGEASTGWSGSGTPDVVIKQRNPSEPGRKYDVSVWVQGESLQNEPLLQVLFDGADDVLDSQTFTASGANDGWTQIAGTTRAAPMGTEAVRFNMSLDDTGGSVWWDQASMVPVEGTGEGDAGSTTDTGGADAGASGVTVGGGSNYLAERRSAGEPTYCNQTGTVVGTRSEFLNALGSAAPGDVVYVEAGASIDMQGSEDVVIPEGVTLASNRGCSGAEGGLLYTERHPWSLFDAESDVTIFGVRIRGPRRDWTPYPGENSGEIGAGVKVVGTGVEIANSELHGFSHFAIQTAYHTHVHHNHIHHNPVVGLGYGVSVTDGHPIVEFNRMNYNRHSVAAGGSGTGYTARYNVVGPDAISHIFDQHKPGGVKTVIHHNTVKAVEQADDPKNTPAVTIRGVPSDVATIHHNWIFNTESPCHSDDGWPGCAILQMHVSDWNNVEFRDNHFGTSEPGCEVGAPRSGCPAP